jgi:DNA repair photolyase
MKTFTGHKEEWGTFIDVKRCSKPINKNKLKGKTVFLASVTECYNLYEEKYCITQSILKQLLDVECTVSISTKSSLILRDMDLLKQIKNISVAMSINTLDESFKNNMDNASSIEVRMNTLKILHENGIHTVLFMSPIFPAITDYKEIIEKSRPFVDEYWFENLNLRGEYKDRILRYINEKYPQYADLYKQIYVKGNKDYWDELAIEIEAYCTEHSIIHTNFFYHEQLVAKKRDK